MSLESRDAETEIEKLRFQALDELDIITELIADGLAYRTVTRQQVLAERAVNAYIHALSAAQDAHRAARGAAADPRGGEPIAGQAGNDLITPSTGNMAAGLAIWEEHRPQSPEDWIAVARRCNEAGAARAVMSPILAALCIALDRLDGR